ncbi:hypothetical protein ABK040_002215 [Willaertia magna]
MSSLLQKYKTLHSKLPIDTLVVRDIRSLAMKPHDLRKKFSLRMIKKITFGYCPLLLRERNRGAKDFFDKCTIPKIKQTNPDCIVTLNVFDNEIDASPSYLNIEFEDGRKIEFTDVSYVSSAAIMEAIQLKKMKIKRYYQIIGKEYYDEEDEENAIALQEKKEEAEAAAGGKKKKKK